MEEERAREEGEKLEEEIANQPLFSESPDMQRGDNSAASYGPVRRPLQNGGQNRDDPGGLAEASDL